MSLLTLTELWFGGEVSGDSEKADPTIFQITGTFGRLIFFYTEIFS